MELAFENVVLTAAQFNPSLFSHLWLVRIGVARDEEFNSDAMLTPAVAQIATTRYELLVTPDRLQLTPRGENDDQKANVIREVMGNIVEKIPHTPFTAIGLNFNWVTLVSDTRSASRAMFCKPDGVLTPEFATQDANFGIYHSKDMLGGRLRVSVNPGHRNADRHPLFQMNFNFERKLVELDHAAIVPTILDALTKWREAKDYSVRLATLIESVTN